MSFDGLMDKNVIHRHTHTHTHIHWKGGRVSWDKVREWHGHIYTIKHKIDS